MKLGDALKCYQELSGKASDVARQLDLAAVAIVWIFKADVAGTPTIPRPLMFVACLAVGALTLDFLQYASGSLIWGYFRRQQERRGVSGDRDFKVPRWFNWPGVICFWGKLALTIATYAWLIVFLAHKTRVV